MTDREVLASKDVKLLRIECRIWERILAEIVQGDLGDLSPDEKSTFHHVSGRAIASLRECAQKAKTIRDPLVFKARYALHRALGVADELADVINSLFFIRMSTQWVDHLVDEAERIEPDSLNDGEKDDLKSGLRRIVKDIETTLRDIDTHPD